MLTIYTHYGNNLRYLSLRLRSQDALRGHLELFAAELAQAEAGAGGEFPLKRFRI